MRGKREVPGTRYNHLVIIEESGKGHHGEILWLCKCDCGNLVKVRGSALRNGNTKSCGCWKRYIDQTQHITHNSSYTRLYRIWNLMKMRCNNPNSEHWDCYGGRGITICDEWEIFQTFKDWALSNGYKENLSIDRIDNNGNYEPTNCRWVTQKEQANNKRNNRLFSYNGENLTISQWAIKIGIPRSALSSRIYKLKWPLEKALTAKYRGRHNVGRII